ncbi:TetR/AcrR family transcriptional regulator [Streptomyces tsukubensis]|uniref:TetR family transcriptional regulator n=1 Tax=Streptomyces tsukubensis TaxID=83656 RepID=A0A1V4ABG8_9ACTN|nr:TetR/AcrR family transcriptional regulator [Streptomyces tsukubensis]OON80866.1 TetR family transcriptional regulator [Streptomyces tsukubensis]QFR93492.1 TetR family transcriptional regulator [Streptomyces tsukubensis]
MPTPEKTSLSRIVAAGRDLLESNGQQGLTMQSVAERVGVRAPSLYKHVGSRAALLTAVAEATVDDLTAQLEATDGSLEELVRGYRRFAQARPEGFRLMHSAHAPPQSLARAAGPILRVSGALAGEQDALEAARLVTAWATGFIEMELNGAFRLGGDVDRAFDYGLSGIRRALVEGRSAARA